MLGVFGIFLNRKNVIVILMSIELILLAVNINLVAFLAHLGDLVGQVFAMFVLTVAAAEAGDRSGHSRGLLPQPRHHRGRRRQHDEGLSTGVHPILIIVFLPLLAPSSPGCFGNTIGAPCSRAT